MVSSCNTAQYTSSDDGDDEEGQRVYKPEENDYEVGGDPGGKDIVTLALPGKANDKGRYREQRFHKLSLSRARYYRESGINKARMHTNKWSKDVRDALNDLSKTSPKGSRLDAFMLYVAACIRNQDALWGEYTKPRWANQRMRLYGAGLFKSSGMSII